MRSPSCAAAPLPSAWKKTWPRPRAATPKPSPAWRPSTARRRTRSPALSPTTTSSPAAACGTRSRVTSGPTAWPPPPTCCCRARPSSTTAKRSAWPAPKTSRATRRSAAPTAGRASPNVPASAPPAPTGRWPPTRPRITCRPSCETRPRSGTSTNTCCSCATAACRSPAAATSGRRPRASAWPSSAGMATSTPWWPSITAAKPPRWCCRACSPASACAC